MRTALYYAIAIMWFVISANAALTVLTPHEKVQMVRDALPQIGSPMMMFALNAKFVAVAIGMLAAGAAVGRYALHVDERAARYAQAQKLDRTFN